MSDEPLTEQPIVPPAAPTDHDALIAKMNATAMSLLELVTTKKTTDTQKGRLFTAVHDWVKTLGKLKPTEDGNTLKEMSDALAASAKGNRAAGTDGRARATRARDGKAIRAIIKSLPTYSGNARGDSPGAQRPDDRSAGDGGGSLPDRGGDVSVNVDEPVDSLELRSLRADTDALDRVQVQVTRE